MFRFTPRTIPNQIYVVGCGGTGSRLVPLLVQFIASITKDKSPRGWLDNPTIYLVDDDIVETKNLARQNFAPMDVGKSKAAVLANRYGKVYGVNVVPVMKRVDGSMAHFVKDVPATISFQNSMVIMCVDTAQARRDILKTIGGDTTISPMADGNQGFSPFIIDAGNEDAFGQVRFFNFVLSSEGEDVSQQLSIPAMSPIMTDIPAIPIDTRYYIEMKDMPGQGSCADLDQTLAINASMATEIMEIVQNYYYVRPMKFNMSSRSLDGDRMTIFNTARWLKDVTITNDADFRVAQSVLLGKRHSVLHPSVYLRRFIQETQKAIEDMNNPSTTEIEAAPKRKSRSKKTVEDLAVEIMPPLPEGRVVEEAARDETFALTEGGSVVEDADDMDF